MKEVTGKLSRPGAACAWRKVIQHHHLDFCFRRHSADIHGCGMRIGNVAEDIVWIATSRSAFMSELHQIDSLRKLHPDPIVEINPETATRLHISAGDWVCVESPYAKVKLRAMLFDGIAPDVVNAEHAWWYPESAPPDYR
jgi:anaerobic selenocysteine-containing dehydrogenase